MAAILLVTDSPELEEELASTLDADEHTLYAVSEGRAVRAAAAEIQPDVVLLDSQIGSMGGIAVCIDLRLEADAGRLEQTRIILLLDRRADVFTAKRCGADGYLVKPLNSLMVANAVETVLDGNLFLDNSYQPLDSSYEVREASTLVADGK
ncbi:response regulator transcription factor [Ferrimicrobium acidiphilum]|uniref:response regulator transcription factor n=1 Tax=Ferrimicrobium acidiphilum TaxID=121039 RepID=UPI0023F246C3|nr:response regulator [Ferrimicrobium acidiphilum]